METKDYSILIVEDEYINAKFIEQIVTLKGHHVIEIVSNADHAIAAIKREKIDLVFMDINIDGPIDGIRCSSLLNQFYQIPIIYMTAYGDTQTIDEACDTNMLGYIIKPFDTADVEAALAVALKMLLTLTNIPDIQTKSTCIEFENNYTYTFKTKTLTINNSHVELTKKEGSILHLFCLNINQNISYDLLLEYVWKDHAVTNSTIRDTISRLRRKAPLLQFENIASIGYRLTKV